MNEIAGFPVLFLQMTSEESVETVFVVRVAAVDYDVGCLGMRGEEVSGVVVPADDGDFRVTLRESFGHAAEKDSDIPVRMSGGYGVQNGAADVACSTCAVVDVRQESTLLVGVRTNRKSLGAITSAG
jgi:hypothetical protein